jgi:hypothetical protein
MRTPKKAIKTASKTKRTSHATKAIPRVRARLVRAKFGGRQSLTVPASASKAIDKQIADLPDWRGKKFAKLRKVIHEADPDVVEEVKWRKPSKPTGVAVWSHNGAFLLVNAFKDKVNLTFYEGARLADKQKLFNSRLEGNKWRAIDFHEGDEVDEQNLKALIRAAVALNTSKTK